MSSILGVNGQSWVELGGERCWEQRIKGDIVISYQWLTTDKEEPQACMVLFPVVTKMDGGAYAIPQQNAYQYANKSGGPTPQLLASAYNAAVQMGFFPDQSTVFRIVDLIVDGLADLVKMPSDQPERLNIKRAVMGIEASAKVNGKVIHQEVI